MRSPHKISAQLEVVWRSDWNEEPAFRKNCEGLEVTGRISYWNGRRCGAPIGLKFFLGIILG